MRRRVWERIQLLAHHDVTVIAGSTAVAHTITMCAAPILSRIYGAQEFGAFQVYTSILGFFMAISCCRYELAILLPQSDRDAADLVFVAIASAGLMGITAGAVMWLVPHTWVDGTARILLPVAIFGHGVFLACTYWSLRVRGFAQMARAKVIQGITLNGVQLSAGVASLVAQGLIFGDALARIAAAASLGRACARSSRRLLIPTPARLWSAAVMKRVFPLVSTPSMMLNGAGLMLPPLLFAEFYGLQCIGLYALVDRVLAAPSALIGQATSQVYMSRMSGLIKSDGRGMRALYSKATTRLAAIGIVPAAVIAVWGPGLFAFVFGEQWREAGVYARIMAAPSLLGFISWPATPTLSMLGTQAWQLGWDAMRMIAGVAALYVAHTYDATAQNALLALSAAMTASYLVQVWLGWLAIRRISPPVLKDRDWSSEPAGSLCQDAAPALSEVRD